MDIATSEKAKICATDWSGMGDVQNMSWGSLYDIGAFEDTRIGDDLALECQCHARVFVNRRTMPHYSGRFLNQSLELENFHLKWTVPKRGVKGR